MKALLTVTGRGMGGDAVIALNIAKALEKKGMKCEFALDHQAPGLLFKKRGISWHKISIPQAGGHAANKYTLLKASAKSLLAAKEGAKLIRTLNPDIVVGVIGGGAIIGALSARLANIPSIGVVATPTDSKILIKITEIIALPESPLFRQGEVEETQLKSKNKVHSSYLPINHDIVRGSRENIMKSMPSSFKKDWPTILFSSGSSLFEKMAQAAGKIGDQKLDANILVVGEPLKEELNDYLKSTLNLGYVDNLPDLYRLADLVVLSDDGLMIHEALACELPIIALLRVKYGRYHNMEGIFPGAVVECDLDELEDNIKHVLEIKDEIKDKSKIYAELIKDASPKIAEIIMGKIPKK
ncbi:MAG: glycosyltransferase [Euryarchaeota archaeon]|jgi:UDP-N-acetylglucosamine--N-acetylmuramyl-(pentapeptide) pyrophosphoryl-undecaprenol N-acetylglucosamine transferase|uniref:glycosyltransferase n=1 Tax=Methanobacterium sp. MZD130B TaxID=3394378 RepID=UPI00176C531A|nr:glycosyltransferase [Euryarchaeota archaeon]HHT19297.1 glycosyltransferase [Methanobacterium sp.]